MVLQEQDLGVKHQVSSTLGVVVCQKMTLKNQNHHSPGKQRRPVSRNAACACCVGFGGFPSQPASYLASVPTVCLACFHVGGVRCGYLLTLRCPS